MSDLQKAREEHERARLLKKRRQALSTGDPMRVNEMNAENTRRDEEDAGAGPAEKPRVITPSQPYIPPIPDPPDENDINDRFHKKADEYITVAKPHSITSDPVRLPGAYETVQEAIDHAEADIIPNFTGDERVVIEIHGGLYEEDITVTSPKVDIHGIGMPVIRGTMTAAVGANENFYAGIELDGVDTYAVDLPALTEPAATDLYGPVFFNCKIHSESTAFRTLGRVVGVKSRIWVDWKSDYTNLDSAALQVYLGSHAMWSEFYECRIQGAPDRRAVAGANGFPNKGRAWHAVGKNAVADIVYVQYPDNTGLMFRDCRIVGYGWNEVWQVYHDHGKCYGGKKHATAGEVYAFNSGSTDESVQIVARMYWNHTGVACRYLVQQGDMSAFAFAPPTEEYLWHFKQLSNGGDHAGSMIVPANTLFTGYGNPPNADGTVYGEHSISWREYMHGPAAAELGILCNCDTDLAHHTNTNFVFGTGALQTILTNPYRL